MRYQGANYDAIRQPAICASYSTQALAKKAVLASLRWDDLMSYLSPDDDEPKVVVSRTDLLDGALFHFAEIEPQDLLGINLEIAAPERIVESHAPVTETLSGWIRDEAGVGQNVLLFAIRDLKIRLEVADTISKMRNIHPLKTVDDLCSLLSGIGLSDESEKLGGFWKQWESGLNKDGCLRGCLKPFPKGAANAAPGLRAFCAQLTPADNWDLSDFGKALLRKVIQLVEKERGRREDALHHLLRSELCEDLSEGERLEVQTVKRIFGYYCFRSIAECNGIDAGYSASSQPRTIWSMTQESDAAPSEEELEKLESWVHEVQACEVEVPSRVISGLGVLNSNEYMELRGDFASRFRAVFQEYYGGDSGDALHKAGEDLARCLPDGGYVVTPEADAAGEWVWKRTVHYLPKALTVILPTLGVGPVQTALAREAAEVGVQKVDSVMRAKAASVGRGLLTRQIVGAIRHRLPSSRE